MIKNDLFSDEELQQLIVTTMQASGGDPDLPDDQLQKAIRWAGETRLNTILLDMVLEGEMGLDVSRDDVAFIVFSGG